MTSSQAVLILRAFIQVHSFEYHLYSYDLLNYTSSSSLSVILEIIISNWLDKLLNFGVPPNAKWKCGALC